MADQAAPGLRVLLIDDNSDFITTYRMILDAKRIPVDIANTGTDPIRLLTVIEVLTGLHAPTV